MITELAAALFTGSAVYAGAALRLARDRDAHQAEIETLRSELASTQKERDELRDLYESALDALSPLTEAAEAGHGVDAALDPARWVLAGGNYTGELRAAREALEQAEADLDVLAAHLHEYGSDDVDEHAARAIAIVRATADQVQPSPDALDRIRTRIKEAS